MVVDHQGDTFIRGFNLNTKEIGYGWEKLSAGSENNLVGLTKIDTTYLAPGIGTFGLSTSSSSRAEQDGVYAALSEARRGAPFDCLGKSSTNYDASRGTDKRHASSS